MRLGEAISAPTNELENALRSAVEGVPQEKGAAAAALREIIEQQTRVVTQLVAIVDQLHASSEASASAARSLAMVTKQPAPVVEVAAPHVVVEAPVTVEQPGPRTRRLTPQRDRDGLITSVIEEYV